MKKILLSIFVMFIYLCGSSVTLANDGSEAFSITDEGIIIYGEDISKLSEEELQYIPKAWRDGNFKSEHVPEVEDNIVSLFSIYPDVNSYIRNHVPVSTTYQYKDFFTKFPYRNGLGKIEGVVAHETANNRSTIRSEIEYMSRNHENAFVHAFINDNNVIEIHPLDYGAWGAGRIANQRFVHVELVRVHSFDQFARSINNYANYIANILYDYRLGVSNAEHTGVGTLWSHKAVSVHLGHTTHIDPHDYFYRYGYDWNKFITLVTEKYNSIIPTQRANTSKLGHLKSDNVMKYSNPITKSGASKLNKAHSNKVFYIKAEVVVNNRRYYLISEQPSAQKGVYGWVEAKDMRVHEHYGVDAEFKTLTVNGKGQAFTKAWGGPSDLVYDLSTLSGSQLKVNKTEKVGNNTWYRGTLKGKQVFIHEAYLNLYSESATSRLGHLKKDAKIYSKVDDVNSAKDVDIHQLNRVYYIKKQATFDNERYYLISDQPSAQKGTIGWVKSKDINVHVHRGLDTDAKLLMLNGNGQAFTKAWGGSQDLVYDLARYSGAEFRVNKTETVGNNIWYRGMLEGKQVFIHEAYVGTVIENSTSKLGHLRDDAKIYSQIADINSTTKVSESHLNQVYYIQKEANLANKQFLLISDQPSATRGIIGWVEAKDIRVHPHYGVDTQSKTFVANGTGQAFIKAWGGTGDLVYDLSGFSGSKLKVNKTERVGNNTWYRGILEGRQVFIHEAFVSPITESVTSRLGHLKSTAKIFGKIGDVSSSYDVKTNQLNQVYYIKKQADFQKERYYLISKEPSSAKGTIGWVKAKELNTHTHKGINTKSKTLITNGRGKAYTKAWGGPQDLVYDLSNYAGLEIHVNKTERVGSNTWYRGILEGRQVFIHEAYIR